MWGYGQCNQVNHEVQKKQDSRAEQQEVQRQQQEAQRQQQELPVDKQEYPAVSQLLMEFEDIFLDKLDTSDRLATGELDLKIERRCCALHDKPGAESQLPRDAWVHGSSQGPSGRRAPRRTR